MIPEKVRAILDTHGLTPAEFAPGSTATSVLAAQQLGVTVGQIAKSLLFLGTFGCCTSAGCWEPSGPARMMKMP